MSLSGNIYLIEVEFSEEMVVEGDLEANIKLDVPSVTDYSW